MTTTTVGRFTFDEETGEVTGPRAYMESEHYKAWTERFRSGNDPVFRVGMGFPPIDGALYVPDGPQAPDAATAMLVSLQTDYAAWHGAETLRSSAAVGRA